METAFADWAKAFSGLFYDGDASENRAKTLVCFTPLLFPAFVKTLETAFSDLDSNLISPICRLHLPFQAFVSVLLLPVSMYLLAFKKHI